MTTNLTGFDLFDTIEQLGMQQTSQNIHDPEFESSDRSVVGRVLALLHEKGYTLLDSRTRGADVYSMVLSAPDDEPFPAFIDVRYVTRPGVHPFLALCYKQDDRLIQYVKPYRTFVSIPCGDEEVRLVAEFHTECGADTPYFWVPILPLSPYVHH